ncbi:putative metal-sulfur cluster biosynthetic enzyme [Bernardetia litoralis DSM 6794]|uniref:Putative metal-sulfur cluster biosynthetic enzyme n=1 Tax=Bernardetia litoralis (strain ATCC 23117 / DSM 6794 / NBRC 15988 / NCIMB 1366 / Fx l1 / Sio-4) TaxID=880071 RepID=U3GKZ6_BERLS|nr:iron-sulfur cluster assembly protein [Bernardetia litoralis]AFM06378.1 putative metal-sulfur cluster biosynthetic enzyme [Bernardetia litoralis DSM 6794]
MENKEITTSTVSTRDRVINAIQSIFDPEIPVDIYELGLIYEINTVELVPNNASVHILMTLTSPNCPSAEQIPSEVKEKVSAVVGVKEVEVELTFDPPYEADMMSEAARLQLGFM